MAETSSTATAPPLQDVLRDLSKEEAFNELIPANPEKTTTQQIGTLCQKKTLYEGPSKCDCCINWVEQYPADIKDSAEEETNTKLHAILCRVQKSHGKTTMPLELHSIVVQSPLLKSILEKVFDGYPGITTTLEKVEFSAPFWEFFYRWEALAEVQHESNYVRLLIDELTSQLGGTHRTAKDLTQNNVMTYDFLWTLFPPSTLVYSRLFDRDCILEVQRTVYDKNTNTYDLRCRYIEWDGESFGWKETLVVIPKFSGTRSIRDLKAYPVIYHTSPESIQSVLSERGRKFVALRGWQQKAYNGVILLPKDLSRGFDGGIVLGCAHKLDKLHINERIMVDSEAYFQQTRSSADLGSLDKDQTDPQSQTELSDRLLMLCSPLVKAYALKTKYWGLVYVDEIADIHWDNNAFDKLVLENETKRLIKSFVSAQIKQSRCLAFDDIVEGKGQGTIMLLTGEPGIGKTLTAETVAENARCPLYMLSAGELGISSREVEEGLTEVFDLAYRWNAVLLIDESDVFLEQRTSDNLERNQLVSIFLRMLEYYRGMLFLTTNRVSAFDVAFQSRIHLTLHYQGLDHVSRRRVWEILLERAQAGISSDELDVLAEERINGRQIKNAVKASKLLATEEDVPLRKDHIDTVLRIMRRAYNTEPFSSQNPTQAPSGDLPAKGSRRTPQFLSVCLRFISSRWVRVGNEG
ncbi:P-loop containing nucleoside triphosphate hydrolase protein [Xylaria curta]|nr:P-loop containing nucleoside triphosphate hydrolase protein [Xylaria curta]